MIYAFSELFYVKTPLFCKVISLFLVFRILTCLHVMAKIIVSELGGNDFASERQTIAETLKCPF
jgi:hypothetical protein